MGPSRISPNPPLGFIPLILTMKRFPAGDTAPPVPCSEPPTPAVSAWPSPMFVAGELPEAGPTPLPCLPPRLRNAGLRTEGPPGSRLCDAESDQQPAPAASYATDTPTAKLVP